MLARSGRRIRLADAEPSIDPEMGERVATLLAGLRAAGASPPRVEGIAGRLGITPAVIDQLRAAGQLRQIAPGIDYPAEVWSALRAKVEGINGTITVARLRDELHTWRRHAEAILAAASQRAPPPHRPRFRPRSQRVRGSPVGGAADASRRGGSPRSSRHGPPAVIQGAATLVLLVCAA